LFYANDDKYSIPWSDVDQVFIPVNETDQHWCLAHLDILSGLVTFYDSGDMYDYEWRDCMTSGNAPSMSSGNAPSMSSGNAPSMSLGNAPSMSSGNAPGMSSGNDS
nr:phospholipase-like protein [Tanacetum cinerariifolium]